MKGDTIQYIYTNSKHNNPLCRVVPMGIGNTQAEPLSQYDKEKYKEMMLDAAETVNSNAKQKKARKNGMTS